MALKFGNAFKILRTVVLGAALFPVLSDSAVATSAEDVIKKIADLQDSLKNFDGKQADIASKLGELRKALLERKLVGETGALAFQQYSAEIQLILNDNVLRQQVQNLKPAVDSAKQMSAALNKMNDDSLVQDRFRDLLTTITSLINASQGNQVALSIGLLDQTANGLLDARKKFDDAWGKIEERKIHIIESSFGDLRSRWREGRLCVSTNAIRRLCQEQTKCTVAVTEALCGFDPAPLADLRYKAAAVKFACVQGGKQLWDELAQHPGINPRTERRWQAHDTYTAILRGNAMEVRCPYPVSAESK